VIGLGQETNDTIEEDPDLGVFFTDACCVQHLVFYLHSLGGALYAANTIKHCYARQQRTKSDILKLNLNKVYLDERIGQSRWRFEASEWFLAGSVKLSRLVCGSEEDVVRRTFMMPFQLSPVATRNNVRNAMPKLRK